MTRLRTEKGDSLTARDVVNAAKKLFGYMEKYARLLGQLSVLHQGRNEPVSEYATHKLALAAMVADHPNNPMSREDFEDLERSTFYDGAATINPQLWSPRSTMPRWTSGLCPVHGVGSGSRSRKGRHQEFGRKHLSPSTRKGSRKRPRIDGLMPSSPRGMPNGKRRKRSMKKAEQQAEAADDEDDEEEPAAFVQQMTQMAQDDQNRRHTCGHCGERHTAANPWTKCPKLRQTMTDRLNRGGTSPQVGRGPQKQDDRSGCQNGSSRGSRPPQPQNKKEPPAGSNGPSGGSTT